MKTVFFVLWLSLIVSSQETGSSFKNVKSYILKDLNQSIKPSDLFVIFSIDICNTCLIQHINTLNTSTKLLNVIAVGNSKKKISFKLKDINRKYINLIYDSKNIAVKKEICSAEELVVFSMSKKNVAKIPYDDFYSLAYEIK
ncbi:MAG: hypothetical protein ACK5H1_03290 [Tenacibaculum sp.]